MTEAAEPLTAVQADADAPEGVQVVLSTDTAEVTVTVTPPAKWRARAVRDLRQGDFLSWADGALSREDAQAVTDADPSIEDFEAFFTAWGEATGESRGKSSRSRSSSGSTRKR